MQPYCKPQKQHDAATVGSFSKAGRCTLTNKGIFVTVLTHVTKSQVKVSSMLKLNMLTVPAALILSCGCTLRDRSFRF